MLNNHGFDLWADGYDKSVEIADEKDYYPFAGYKKLMNAVYSEIMDKCPAKVLDIGLGTATLSSKLYEKGNEITGIDFSDEMLNISRVKMPEAVLLRHDFTKGLPVELQNSKFDFIVSTYAIHHLSDDEQINLIFTLLNNLLEGGKIILGDVFFKNIDSMNACKTLNEGSWDDDENYMVFSEIEKKLSGKCALLFTELSHCSGIIEIKPL